MHWGTFPVLAQSMDGFKELVAKTAPGCGCTVMQPGQTVPLP